MQWDCKTEYSVALTKHGRLVVYEWDERREEGSMEIFDDFDEMGDAMLEGPYSRYPENIIAATAAGLENSHEIELDI